MQPLSVVILTKNCQSTLANTLFALRSFSEVILLDTGSTDRTLEIAELFGNVRIHAHGPVFPGFGPLRNKGGSLANNDWILALDSDEILSEALVEELSQLSFNPTCVYSVERRNHFNGKWIRWCAGWHPDRVIRLYHRRHARYSDDLVHEKISAPSTRIVKLRHPMLHTPYRRIEDFLTKMQIYSTLFAEQRKNGRSKSSIFKAWLHSYCAFWKNYICKRGFLGGGEGLLISLYNAHTTFYKYLKLWEKEQELALETGSESDEERLPSDPPHQFRQ